MKLAFNSFAGEIPRMEPRYLPETHAAAASGARLNRGNLEPMNEPVVVNTFASDAQSFFVYGASFLQFSTDADCVQGPVALDRLYITYPGGVVPKMLYSGTYYNLALPAPTGTPTVALTSGTLDPTLAETVLYAWTWLTSLGEESAPSPLSAGISWSPGCTITVTMPGAAPASRLVTLRRIYRSVTSASGATELYFVAQISSATTTFAHDLATSPTVEAITSKDFDEPPATLQGLVAMPNGMMAGFSGRDIFFCEPYQPHAWPDKYALHVNDTIVGLAAFGSSVAILTTGMPYVAQGIHPESMAMERMEVMLPCVSKRGIVDMGYAAIYPSTDGLVQISQQGAKLISGGLWTKQQWQKLITPTTVRAGYMMGRYVMSYQTGGTGTRKMAIIEVDEGGQFVINVASEAYVDFHYDIGTGQLFALRSDLRNVVNVDDPTGALKTLIWKSKPVRLPGIVSMGAYLFDTTPPASAPAFSCAVYANGALLFTTTTPNAIGRLPANLAEVWQIEITTNHTVTRAVIAGSPDEIFQ